MRLVQVISDYIRRSILTTQGDLVVRGAAQPERLASGILHTILKGQGLGIIPAYDRASFADMHIQDGAFTRNSTGVEQIRGLVFAPELLYLQTYDSTATNPNWSLGVVTKSFTRMFRIDYNGARCGGSYITAVIVRRTAVNKLTGIVSAFVSDGFDITFTLVGVCSLRVQWMAFG